MEPRELVINTIKGTNNTNKTPKYGWVLFELEDKINKKYGSVKNFEDYYNFDLAHIFGGPFPFDRELIGKIAEKEGEFTPEMFLDLNMNPVDRMEDWQHVIKEIDFYKNQRKRFTYLQSYSLFEPGSAAFGFENQLLYMALYPKEMKEFYDRMAKWDIEFAGIAMDLGIDMVHLSDDWGSQRSLIFSPQMFKDFFAENIKKIAASVKRRGKFLSLHSDGYIYPALPTIVEAGFDVIHPWQESAGMDYQSYLDNYADKFAIMGGVCVQTTFGFSKLDYLKSEIERVFKLLKGKRWICCTTHFVESTCSIEELDFGFSLIKKLAENG